MVVLITDQQARLSDGGQELYVGTAIRLNTPEALRAAGLAIEWDPALSELTLHRFRLIRDGKPIDLLGDGSRLTVVRRESSLEQATIDGRLTATYQPEDVRVGDTVELAYTLNRRDPALAGRLEIVQGWLPGVPLGRARMRVLSPIELKQKAHPGVPPLKVNKTADGVEYVVDVGNFTPPRPPRNAPRRAQLADFVEFTNAASWAEVARTARRLFEPKATITPGSALAAEVARLKAASPDPKIRAQAALKLVQEQVRYLLLALDGGGFTPASAEETWQRRFGDYKGKTVLLLAMLRAMGIEAQPVLVHSVSGDAHGEMLPRLQSFDHVLVRVRIGGRDYWLDGTRTGDDNLDRINPPRFRYALPLTETAQLEPVPLPKPERALIRQTLDLDAREGLTVPAKAMAELRAEGELATMWRVTLRQLSPTDRERTLREFWRNEHAFVEPDRVEAVEEPATGAIVLTATGTARMDWGQVWPSRYEADGANIGFEIDTTRDEELGKDAPFEVSYPFWKESRQTILLPNKGAGFRIDGSDVDERHGPWTFRRTAKLDGERFMMSSSVRSTEPEMPAAVARAEESAFLQLAKGTVWVNAPMIYRPTQAELAALKTGPALPSAGTYVYRAARLLDVQQVGMAIADLEAALKLEPDNAEALGRLGVTLIERGVVDRGAKLVSQALGLNPKQPNALAGRAALAIRDERFADAERDYTAVLEQSPDWQFALSQRAFVRAKLEKMDLALQDATALERAGMDADEVSDFKARLVTEGKDTAAASAALDKLVAERPDDATLRRFRAQFRSARQQDKAGAREDYDYLIARAPSASLYLERAQLWDAVAQADKWRADLVEAARLEPRNALVPMARAAMEVRRKDFGAAVSAADEGVALDPDSQEAAEVRIQVLRAAGRLTPEREIAELTKIAKRHPDAASIHNSLCWARATANLQLAEARGDCEAALRLIPLAPAYLDSRGLLHFRLRDYRAALADYDLALAAAPDQTASLYGRGLVKLAMGNKAGATADFEAARKITPVIDEEFRGYGLAAPDAPRPAAADHASSD